MEEALSARAARFWLKCLECGSDADVPSVWSVYCECGGLYEIRYRDAARRAFEVPLADARSVIRLGHGDTPLVRLDRVAEILGVAGVYGKLEFCSVTGSFKDRGSAMLVSAAVEEGVSGFVEDSSGNAGASMAAYAAAAGIKAHVFAPSSAAVGKLDQIRVFGAELHLVDGPRQASTDAAREFAEAEGLLHLSHALSPWFAEGVKPLAHEVVSEVSDEVTDVVAPAGNGALVIGISAGYSGFSGRPRVHCVQSEGVSPLVSMFKGEEWDAKEDGSTVASGISVSDPPRGRQAVGAVVDSGGVAIAVSDESMLGWRRRLAELEGVFCEVTSASALAGLEALVASGEIGEGAVVLLPITGSGLKEKVG